MKKAVSAKKHDRFMQHAIRLAKKAKGKTYPNPLVGAVIVKSGRIIGEGYHKKAGKPHAEIIAIRKGGESVRGSELYVSLEPCAHYGKTPPCVNNIVQSGIKTVYVAIKDPNPLVSGNGLRKLREHGVKVKTGFCKNEAMRINKEYIERIKKTRKK